MGPFTTKFKLIAIVLVILAAQFTYTIAQDDDEGKFLKFVNQNDHLPKV